MAKLVPNWMMLDRFVYRRDDEEAFPDESSPPLRASSCTSLGQMFEVAFLPANPPDISRFSVRWPGGTKLEDGQGTDLVNAHRDLILFKLTSVENLEEYPYLSYTQDHFVCKAFSEPEPHLQLKRLPVCTIPVTIPAGEEEENETVLPRVFFPKTVGLLRQFASDSAEERFVVAQLAKVSKKPESREMEAELCVLRSRVSTDDGDGKWEVMTLAIQHEDHEYGDLWYWSTDDVVTFNNYICWVDYYRGGMLFYDALQENPMILYRRLDISNRPTGSAQCQTLPEMNRRLCVTTDVQSGHHRDALRFVDVARSDDYLLGPFELGSGFTIRLTTLSSVNGVWFENVRIKSEDLWARNIDLPPDMLMFPLVNMSHSYLIHFLVSRHAEEDEEAEEETKKVFVVHLEMRDKHVLAIDPYIEGKEDADMIKEKAHQLKGFISSRFPLFLKFKPDKGFLTEEQYSMALLEHF